ncbi:MAG: S-adenosylmethionine:tRNA ribosyltransferase-isomerase, partial [Epsilonproteobacteria bacterium]|nr:tRNA preQ1(34) S-adenosylmethionine ribosyltransferase-isomerase QueA [Campylobacterota bacterium]NPA57315.1 S-adenosylmethionine:tRNA ribosyltransferase-isomerase [Campylobacterota bacterium]
MKKSRLDPTKTSSYNYRLPKELIAREPVVPADRARLLVYRRKSGEVSHHTFQDLPDLIPEGSSLIFNDTKVIKARLFGKKRSGGRIELLLNRPLPQGGYSVFIRGRVRVGTRLLFPMGLEGEVVALQPDGSRVVRFFREGEELDFQSLVPLLDEIGHIPLPPYIDREERPDDLLHYQSPLAREAGAVAAPTASLHFTPQLLERLRKRFTIETITLHVGAGTFKPVEV